MNPTHSSSRRSPLLALLLCLSVVLSSCGQPASSSSAALPPQHLQGQAQAQEAEATAEPTPSPFPSRPLYAPGELVDYVAQTGDTLPFLAARFNTTVEEILEANPFIPGDATTMPPGMPMRIPIYYLPLWGSQYQILPDSHYVNGPAVVSFDTSAFVDQHPGWLRNYRDFVSDSNRSGAQIVDLVALNYSISPRLLLAVLEYQSGALSQPDKPDDRSLLGMPNYEGRRLFSQLAWAANKLNNGYYGYRSISLTVLEHDDGRIERIDPWQNAASVSLMNFFNDLLPDEAYFRAISSEGFAATYASLFGDPWASDQPHIPGSLTQPELTLPFEHNDVWAYTGGPHTGWGTGEPYSAIDFAPPTIAKGCVSTDNFAVAVTSGLVVRSEVGQVLLDLDGDGDERTGWVIFYLHMATEGRVKQGVWLERGDPVGHPSCEGGNATGTHLHIARKYNGEWLQAHDATLPFNMEGWVARMGSAPYLGTLERFTQKVTACTCSNAASFIKTERQGK